MPNNKRNFDLWASGKLLWLWVNDVDEWLSGNGSGDARGGKFDGQQTKQSHFKSLSIFYLTSDRDGKKRGKNVMKLCVCNKSARMMVAGSIKDVLLWWCLGGFNSESCFGLFSINVLSTQHNTKEKKLRIMRFLHFTSISLPFPTLFLARLLCEEVNQDESFHLEDRGPVQMKGRAEPMRCWFLSRKSNPSSPPAIKTTPTATRTNVETEV